MSSATDKAQPLPNDVKNAVRVLQTEVAGLQKLAAGLDDRFSETVQMIAEMKARRAGRLIVAGIGKSGHIARKVTATMASTGTPSYFVHPGEASHGDLGMVMEDDIVLMLSNSGENAELSDLIHYTRRFDIPLIAMTGNADSTLGRHADKILLLPDAPEACPNGMAPTTSSTMMLALGDALAISLLERQGLTTEQFKMFHPGGKLGQKLLKTVELMHKGGDLPLVTTKAKMGEALIVLTEKNLGCVLVADDTANELYGIITDGDLKRHMAPDLLEKPVTEVMTADPKTIEESTLAVEAMNMMTKTPGQYLTSLVVVDDKGRLSGLIRLQDCIQAGIQ